MGYRLELIGTPNQHKPPHPMPLGETKQNLVSEEIRKLSAKKAVLQVQPKTGQFLSRLFLVPKKDGSQRPVINLKPLNQFIQKQKFKMEGAKLIRDLLRRKDWMISIDLKDAYLSVPISPQHRKFLRFPWKDSLFEFQCLPFGLTSAPRVFTKLLKPVMAHLRQKGIRCIIFLDDMLVMAQFKEELQKQTQDILMLFQLLGFRINWDKSVLSPTQMIEYLGLRINSVSMAISLPQEKVMNIIHTCEAAMQQAKVSV